jgi:hypothetical protein
MKHALPARRMALSSLRGGSRARACALALGSSGSFSIGSAGTFSHVTDSALVGGGHRCWGERMLRRIRWTATPPLPGLRGRFAAALAGLLLLGAVPAAAQTSEAERQEAIAALPMDRLTAEARQRIGGIVERPTIYRRLPTQAIDCDPQMFVFLTRHPEVLVGIWDQMQITKVQTRRLGPFELEADDGAGTHCTINLIFSDGHTHLYSARGRYTGPFVTRPVTGSGLFLLRSSYARTAGGRTTVTGTLDCFLQLDHLGAELLARGFSGVIGRNADHNFAETAEFMAQVSQASERNPEGVHELALGLPQVDQPTRRQFAQLALEVHQRSPGAWGAAAPRDVRSILTAGHERPATPAVPARR